MEHNTLHATIGVASLSSPLEVGADRAPKGAAEISATLGQTGFTIHNVGVVDSPERATEAGLKAAELHCDAVVFVPACWYEDYLVMDFLEECPVPVLLWPLPGMETGALCGAQQQTSFLKRVSHPYEGVFGGPDDPKAFEKAERFLKAVALRRHLRRAKIGFAGHRVHGMTDTVADEHLLKKEIGPRLIYLDMPVLMEEAEKMADSEVASAWDEVEKKAGKSEVKQEDGLYTMKVLRVLEKMIDEHRLNALTVGCYPYFMGRPCLPASLLADRGIPLGCEGDVNGAVAQLVLTLLTGEPTHNTDWLDPIRDSSGEDTIVMTHCGSNSFSLAENPEEITLAPVRLMDQGVCVLYTAKPGPVTLLNLMSGPQGYTLAVLEGEAVSTEMVFPGDPVRVKFETPIDDLLDWIFQNGVGHHWMVGYGHVGAVLKEWARIIGREDIIISP